MNAEAEDLRAISLCLIEAGGQIHAAAVKNQNSLGHGTPIHSNAQGRLHRVQRKCRLRCHTGRAGLTVVVASRTARHGRRHTNRSGTRRRRPGDARLLRSLLLELHRGDRIRGFRSRRHRVSKRHPARPARRRSRHPRHMASRLRSARDGADAARRPRLPPAPEEPARRLDGRPPRQGHRPFQAGIQSRRPDGVRRARTGGGNAGARLQLLSQPGYALRPRRLHDVPRLRGSPVCGRQRAHRPGHDERRAGRRPTRRGSSFPPSTAATT